MVSKWHQIWSRSGGFIGREFSSLHSGCEHCCSQSLWRFENFLPMKPPDDTGMAPARLHRLAACRLVFSTAPEGFGCRAIVTLRWFHGRIASTTRHIIFHATELTPWKYLWAKNGTCCLETLVVWLVQLVGKRQRVGVSAERGWAKITRQILDAEGSSIRVPQVTRLVVDLNRYGHFSITILAHKVPEPWVSHWPNSSMSPVSILILVPTILARRCQSHGWVIGHRRLTQRFGTVEPRSLEIQIIMND